MKKIFLTALMALSLTSAMAQRHDFANWNRYAAANKELGAPAKGEHRVVFLGNSITDNWASHRTFFADNNIIGRGISGQTSYQFLLRFQEDVIKLQPTLVVINYGTNDIAENTGAYNEDYTFNNVKAMCEMARANKIKVVLTSCLPHGAFRWNTSITDAMPKIISLNNRVKAYAKEQKITFVDYFHSMLSADGSQMREDLSEDGVHPNAIGYGIMEELVLPVVQKQR